MAFSTESFTGVMAQQSYPFTILFISSEYLTITVDGVSVAFTVSPDQSTFTITGATIAGGETIVVTRQTPRTDAGRLVDFNDLSHVRQSDLDLSSRQLLHIAQEALDFIEAATCLALGVSGHWDATNLRIENVAAGVTSTDAVTKAQLDAISVAAGALPIVSAADNDKSLWVVAGAWAIRTPAQARTHLGLGTAALLTAGTGANQVPQLDGSARYPSNDGRNIDLSNHSLLNLRYRTTLAHVLQATEQTPATDATSTWSQTAGSRLTPGTATSLDNSGDITVDNTGKKVTLSAGTWEIEYSIRAYNLNAAAGNDQDLRVKVTNDDDTAGQTVYDTEYDLYTIESAGGSTRALFSLHNTLLVKLPSGGTIVLRAVNQDGADIRVNTTRMMFRKVSTSTT